MVTWGPGMLINPYIHRYICVYIYIYTYIYICIYCCKRPVAPHLQIRSRKLTSWIAAPGPSGSRGWCGSHRRRAQRAPGSAAWRCARPAQSPGTDGGTRDSTLGLGEGGFGVQRLGSVGEVCEGTRSNRVPGSLCVQLANITKENSL